MSMNADFTNFGDNDDDGGSSDEAEIFNPNDFKKKFEQMNM
eukprot:CAMPEP_0176377630 /NCGR_PEP_ID=MMETSP0126-20121128/29034_1 /TAXON_ID=141414 ORGANISM="Strombidinopsis acuminatum, Strain SPMC142" /NCGR_SAMPLE_ID=MMETSP0126 /ASSEMBLY_ACC=CAM_ASM_000229 /LENGTH=40 /DNA_ID= /DNA_START= /DNA_END= /DNA_ORIENTATION=